MRKNKYQTNRGKIQKKLLSLDIKISKIKLTLEKLENTRKLKIN